MIFDYLPENVFVPLSRKDRLLYASLLPELLKFFSGNVEDNPTRNNIIKFLNEHLLNYQQEHATEIDTQQTGKDVYDKLLESGWISAYAEGIGSYTVSINKGMYLLADWLTYDFPRVFDQNTLIEETVEQTFSLAASAKRIFDENTPDTERVMELNSVSREMDAACRQVESVARELSDSNTKMLREQSIGTVRDNFWHDFKHTIMEKNMTLERIPLTKLAAFVREGKSILSSCESDDMRKANRLVNSFIMKHKALDETMTQEQQRAYVLGELFEKFNKIDGCIAHMRKKLTENRKAQRKLLTKYEHKMRVYRIYRNRKDAFRDVLINTIETMRSLDVVPDIHDLDMVRMVSPELICMPSENTGVREAKAFRVQGMSLEAEKRKAFRKAFHAMFERNRHAIVRTLDFQGMHCLHSDSIPVRDLQEFNDIVKLGHIPPHTPLPVDGYVFEKTGGVTHVDGWISIPRFTITETGRMS